MRRAFFVSAVSAVAGFGAGGAACTSVLGLSPPTLGPCGNGCPDATAPIPDATADAAGDVASDAPADAIPDVIQDHGPATGVRCGTGTTEVFCAAPAAVCCLTYSGGAPAYACVASAAACSPAYPIECASDNDCAGSDVCCFYDAGIKCEPENTPSCATALVCDPSDPASDMECNSPQTCSVAYLFDGGSLPYYGCN